MLLRACALTPLDYVSLGKATPLHFILKFLWTPLLAGISFLKKHLGIFFWPLLQQAQANYASTHEAQSSGSRSVGGHANIHQGLGYVKSVESSKHSSSGDLRVESGGAEVHARADATGNKDLERDFRRPRSSWSPLVHISLSQRAMEGGANRYWNRCIYSLCLPGKVCAPGSQLQRTTRAPTVRDRNALTR
jgi:hypothetical protein